MVKKIKKLLYKFRRLDWVFKHIFYKLIGKEDRLWDFNHFDKKVNPATWERYDEIILWAKDCKNYCQARLSLVK
jgi:hypothetical protein